jgi:hemerythrin superfamily protein
MARVRASMARAYIQGWRYRGIRTCSGRVEIQETMTTIQEAFTRDHRRLDTLFERAEQDLGGDWADCVSAFTIFREAIERHMKTEEAWIFPAYEKKYGNDNPLTSILRKGHKDLRAFFDEIAEAIVGQDVDEAKGLVGVVAQILKHHDEKEEAELYPVVAELLGADAPSVAALLS